MLNHLCKASDSLILGSTERHYTPSKSFQAVQARRPVLAVLHEESTAADFLTRARAASVVKIPEGALPSVKELSGALAAFIEDRGYDPAHVRWEIFEEYSARSGARQLAQAMDLALERHLAQGGHTTYNA